MEPLALWEEASMYADSEWDSEPQDWYPASGDDDDQDNLIREGIYAAGDSGEPADHPPTYAEDPSFYDDDPYDMRGWDE